VSCGVVLFTRGDYVRRYGPELAAVAGRGGHEPWSLDASERRALGYPSPVVDHEEDAVRFRRLRESGGR
jgi:deoxyribodipyrimidine photo-lyase